MSDRITKCVQTKDALDVCVQYDVAYVVEDPNDATRTNHFCVVVRPSEMVDPTSEAEAVSLANVRAAAIKAAWLAIPSVTTESKASVLGDVSL